MTVSTDLIYDVLRRHQPDHILLKAARQDAAVGLLDLKRLNDMLLRIKHHVVFKPLEKVFSALRCGHCRNRTRIGLWRGGRTYSGRDRRQSDGNGDELRSWPIDAVASGRLTLAGMTFD